MRYHIVLIVVTKHNLNGKMTNLSWEVPNEECDVQIQGCFEGHVEENTITSFFCSYYSQQFFADHIIECWV